MGLGEQNKEGGRGDERKLSLFRKCLVMTLVYFPKKNEKKNKNLKRKLT